MLKEFKEHLSKVLDSDKFKEYKKKNSDTYLVSFFMNADDRAQDQVDFYSPNSHKICSFRFEGGINCLEDEPFQKEKKVLEKLDVENIKIDFEKSYKKVEGVLTSEYANDQPNKTIVILQVIDGDVVWNFTMITLSFNVLNVKIDASSGRVISHNIENFLKMTGSGNAS